MGIQQPLRKTVVRPFLAAHAFADPGGHLVSRSCACFRVCLLGELQSAVCSLGTRWSSVGCVDGSWRGWSGRRLPRMAPIVETVASGPSDCSSASESFTQQLCRRFARPGWYDWEMGDGVEEGEACS